MNGQRGVRRVVAAVIARGAQLLVCQRPAHKQHGGLWEFPGGKCEPGESDAAATARELDEELGLVVRSVGAPLFTALDDRSQFEIVFLPVECDGEPTVHEHDALHWGTPPELLQMALAPTDRRFVESLASA